MKAKLIYVKHSRGTISHLEKVKDNRTKRDVVEIEQEYFDKFNLHCKAFHEFSKYLQNKCFR